MFLSASGDNLETQRLDTCLGGATSLHKQLPLGHTGAMHNIGTSTNMPSHTAYSKTENDVVAHCTHVKLHLLLSPPPGSGVLTVNEAECPEVPSCPR